MVSMIFILLAGYSVVLSFLWLSFRVPHHSAGQILKVSVTFLVAQLTT